MAWCPAAHSAQPAAGEAVTGQGSNLDWLLLQEGVLVLGVCMEPCRPGLLLSRL